MGKHNVNVAVMPFVDMANASNEDRKRSKPPIPFIDADWRRGLLHEIKRIGRVEVVRWSPDDRWICVGGQDGKAAVYSTETWGLPVQELNRGGEVLSVTWSPCGSFLCVGGQDGIAAVYCTDSWGSPVQELVRGVAVQSVSWSPDGRWICVGGTDCRAAVYSVETWGPHVQELKRAGSVASLAWSPDSSRLCVGCWHGEAAVYDTEVWGQPVQVLSRAGAVTNVSWNPDGHWLCIGDTNNKAAVYSTESWGPAVQELGHGGDVKCVSWSPNGEWLCVGGDDHKVEMYLRGAWSSPVQELVREFGVTSVNWSPDGRYVCVGDQDGNAAVYSTDSWGNPKEIERGEGEWVNSVCWSPDGRMLCVGSDDNKVAVYMADSWETPVQELLQVGVVRCVCWSPDGKWLCVGGCSGKAAIYSTKGWRNPVHELERGERIASMSWSPDGQWLCIGGSDKKAAVYSTKIWGKAFQELTREAAILSVAWSPDSLWLSIGGEDKLAAVYSAETWRSVQELERGGVVRTVSWSMDGKWLCVGGSDKKAAVYSTTNWGSPMQELKRSGGVRVVSWSPDGRWLCVGTGHKKAAVYSALSWRDCPVQELERGGMVTSVSWSPDGRWLCVGAGDNKAAIYPLGPRFSAFFIPLVHLANAVHSHTNLDGIVFPEYCSGQPHETLLQKLFIHSWSIEDICKIVQHKPNLLCAVDTSAGSFDDWEKAKMLRGQETTSICPMGPNALTGALSLNKFNVLPALTGFLDDSLHLTNFPSMIFEIIAYTARENQDALVQILKNIRFVKCRMCQTQNFRADASLLFGSRDAWYDEWTTHYSADQPCVVPVMVPFPGLTSLEILYILTGNKISAQVWDNDMMDAVLTHLWRQYIQIYFYMDFLLCLTFCALWAIFLNSVTPGEDAKIGLSVSILIVNAALMFKEVRSMLANGIIDHFGDPWNFVDLFSSIIVALVVIAHTAKLALVIDGNEVLSKYGSVLASALITAKFVSCLRGFEETAWLVQVLVQNTVDMRSFLLIIMVILFGFSLMFMTLIRSVPGGCDLVLASDGTGSLIERCQVGQFGNVAQAFYRTFLMGVMGDFDTTYLDASIAPWFARGLYVTLCVIVTVISLNALIALLGDSFDKVKVDSSASKRMGRANLIVEYMRAMPQSWLEDIEKESKWIYRVILETDFDDGRIKPEDTTDTRLEEFKKKTDKDLSAMKANISEVKASISEVKNDIAQLHQMMYAALSANGNFPKTISTKTEDTAVDFRRRAQVASDQPEDSGKDDSLRAAAATT